VRKYKVLLLEDEDQFRIMVSDFLLDQGCEVVPAETCASAEKTFRLIRPDIAILDYSLPDGNALDLLPRLKAIDPLVPIILLTGHGSIDLAVEAVKLGADQFLTKPAELTALMMMIERSVNHHRNHKKQIVDQNHPGRKLVDPFLGESAAIQTLREMAHRVLSSDSTVLIQAETGTGKGVLARWLHRNGPRSAEPFVDMNCGGLSKDLLETELFGHQKGAFTGAVQSKTGLLEVANRGTVFLDEIGDVDLAIQPKLLKVLEEKQFRRLGEVQDRSVDTRLIAATHRDLPKLVQEGSFRGDLYFRISTIPLTIPPLRERCDDVPVLAAYLLEGLAGELGKGGIELTEKAIQKLRSYPWPGNIRELRNVLERAVLLSGHELLTDADFHFDMPESPRLTASSTIKTLDEVEREYIQSVLATVGGRVDAAALKLGIPRSSLYHKLKQYRSQNEGFTGDLSLSADQSS